MKYDPMEKQKIAVFSVSAGAGHVRAAQALQAAAERWYPDVEVTHIDLMELVPKLFKAVYADTYIKVVEHHPAFWGYLYDKTDREKVDSALSKLRVAIERLNTQKLKVRLKELDPDHVICTHFLPAQLLSRWVRKGSFRKPVWVQVTDFDVHALWLHDHMSGYFAANEEVAWRMAERGISPATIHVTGRFISTSFPMGSTTAAPGAEVSGARSSAVWLPGHICRDRRLRSSCSRGACLSRCSFPLWRPVVSF